jgi:Flp pilus assembly protein TadD
MASAPQGTQARVLPRAGHRSRWLVFGAAALGALLLYLPTLRYGFVWDDRTLILNNPFLDRANVGQILTGEFWNNPGVERSSGAMSYYRPLANLSVYLDRKVSGLNPTGYHLTNVVVNAAVVFFMCLLLWELFGSVWLAGLGGLVVGIHPAMNCIVTFILNRTYLLAVLFMLVSAYALARGQRGRSRFWPALFSGSLLLGALALEASLIFAALAAAWLLANRSRYRRLSVWMAAAALPIVAYLLLRLGIARIPFAGSDLLLKLAINEPLRIMNTFGQQLQLLVFPFNQKVIYTPTDSFTRFSVYTILGLLFLGLPLYALIRLGRSTARHSGTRRASPKPGPGRPAQPEVETNRLGWYGYAWVVLFLLPFAHLLFLGPSGRMLYLVAPGALILLAALYRATDYRWLTTRVAYGAILLYTALFALQTLRRNPVWRDELTLTRTMVHEAPASAVGHMNYGWALADAGKTEEAVEQYRLAIAINPNYDRAHFVLSHALGDRGDLPGAIRELREVVRLHPESWKVRNDLGVMLTRNGQFEAAIAEYREALRFDPNSVLTLNNLGYAYVQIGDFRQAIPLLKAVLRLDPGFASARADLADAFRKAGMPDSAALVEGRR